MNERKLERKEINRPIAIVDMINGGEFGELINVTIEGIMVMTDREIPTHSIYQLALQLPVEIGDSKQIELGTDCLWCRKAENFHRYWSGFQIIDASDQALSQLQELIAQYAK